MRSSRSSSVSSTASQLQLAPEETIQIFIKPIAGATIPLSLPPSTTISTLLNLLSLRLNLPPSALRLSHAGHHLPLTSTLLMPSLPPHSTLQLSLPLLGGSPKHPRCAFKKDDPAAKCREKIQPIVGECAFCKDAFCSKHRLLESHGCAGLEDCKKEEYRRNAERLEKERTVVVKGV